MAIQANDDSLQRPGENGLARKVVVNVLTNRLISGDVLASDEDICSLYQHSPATLREFEILRKQHIIFEKVGVGFVVTELDLSEVREVHDDLIPLYCRIIKDVLDNISEDSVSELNDYNHNIGCRVGDVDSVFGTVLGYIDVVASSIYDDSLRESFVNCMPVMIRFTWVAFQDDAALVAGAGDRLSKLHEAIMNKSLDLAILAMTDIATLQKQMLSEYHH